jgi:hypothetical protein
VQRVATSYICRTFLRLHIGGRSVMAAIYAQGC